MKSNLSSYYAYRDTLSKQADHILEKLVREPTLASDIQVLSNLDVVKHSVEVILEAFQNPGVPV